MTIARICTRDVDLADPGESVQAAAQRMAARHVGSLVVVDDGDVPIGILTDRDLTVRVLGPGRDPFETKVRDVMTTKLKTVPEDTEISDALDHMEVHGVRRLPVTGPAGKLAGVVSVDDILIHHTDAMRQAHRLLDRSQPEHASD